MKILRLIVWMGMGAVGTTLLWDICTLWAPARAIALALLLIWLLIWLLDDFWCEHLKLTHVRLRGFLVLSMTAIAVGGVALWLFL
jgi:hypothetical protein